MTAHPASAPTSCTGTRCVGRDPGGVCRGLVAVPPGRVAAVCAAATAATVAVVIICRSLTQGAVVFGLVACITVGVWAVGLAVMDCCTGFLPDVLTWPGTVAALIGAVAWGRPELAVGGLAWAVLYLVVAGCVGGVGGGDIKFAPALGTASATGGVLGVCLAIAVAAVATVVMLVAGKRDTIPHAPAMVVGCLVSVACTITGAPV